MPKWLQAAIGVVVIVGSLTALYIAKGEEGGRTSSGSGDHPPSTNYNDDPGLKGLKIPTN